MTSEENIIWNSSQRAENKNYFAEKQSNLNSNEKEVEKNDDDVKFSTKSSSSHSARDDLPKKDDTAINLPKYKNIDIEELNETQRDESNSINGN